MPQCTVVVSDGTDLSTFEGFGGVILDPAPEEQAVYLRLSYGSVIIDHQAGRMTVTAGLNGRIRKLEIPLSCVHRTLDARGFPDFRNR